MYPIDGPDVDLSQALLALRSSEERLRHLVEHAQDIIYYCDLEGRFTYVNPTAARVMQYDEQMLLGRHFLTLIRPDFRGRAADLYMQQIVERTPNTYFEFPAVTKEGGTIWLGQQVQLVYEGDVIAGVQAIARDITRQKDAEERLRRSEARYRSLIQGAAFGIYRTAADGTILDANPALAQMLGYDSVDEVLALNMAAVYQTAGEHRRLVERHQQAGRQFQSHVKWKRKDGTPITVRLTVRFVEFEDEGTPSFEAIAEDVTERRALEEQLRRAQKMEAIGRLARGVAHDFNNVLAAIVGCADLLLLRLKPGNPARAEAEEIAKAADRGAALTKQLLTFSRRQAVEAQVIDVHAVVARLDGMLKRLTGSDVTLQVRTPGPAPLVRVESGQLEQVVMNLVVNARDAMPDGGTVEVDAGTIELDDRQVARYPGMPAGRYARIAVRDTGVGIEPENQPHIFEPFFTTKDEAKGTGLGLSMVYGIAKEAGGTVTFATGVQEGTTFEVLLPLVDPQT